MSWFQNHEYLICLSTYQSFPFIDLICCRNGNGQHGHVGITQWKITRVFSEHDEALINRWWENVFAKDVYKDSSDQDLTSL